MKIKDTQKIANIIYIIFIVCILVFCFGVSILSWREIDEQVSETENRKLIAYDMPTKKTLFSGEWFFKF